MYGGRSTVHSVKPVQPLNMFEVFCIYSGSSAVHSLNPEQPLNALEASVIVCGISTENAVRPVQSSNMLVIDSIFDNPTFHSPTKSVICTDFMFAVKSLTVPASLTSKIELGVSASSSSAILACSVAICACKVAICSLSAVISAAFC